MKILKFPDEHLFKSCKPVTVFGPELNTLLETMWETMKSHNGMGLASNQVGLSYNMFVMEGPQEDKLFIVNPVIIKKSLLLANLKEGCLSAPGEFLKVDRALWVTISFNNELGDKKIRSFKGIHAVCVQHEMEHLEGKSFLESKSIPKTTRRQLSKKWGFKIK